MRLLFDTNVILDVLLKRQPFGEVAVKLMARVESGDVAGYICGTTVTTIYYIVRKHLGVQSANTCISSILTIFDVAQINRPVLLSALNVGFTDYEDAVIHESARAISLDGIVTRNQVDFKKSQLPVYSPDELISILEQ